MGLALKSDLLQAQTKELVKAQSSDSELVQPIKEGIEDIIPTMIEASSNVDLREGSADGVTMPILGVSTTSSVYSSATVPSSTDGARFEVGELSGVSQDDESGESESVRVDLADLVSVMGLSLIMPAPLG